MYIRCTTENDAKTGSWIDDGPIRHGFGNLCLDCLDNHTDCGNDYS